MSVYTDKNYYIVTEEELTDVADAIRDQLESSEGLTFPNGFITGIGNISGGGSSPLQDITDSFELGYDDSEFEADFKVYLYGSFVYVMIIGTSVAVPSIFSVLIHNDDYIPYYMDTPMIISTDGGITDYSVYNDNQFWEYDNTSTGYLNYNDFYAYIIYPITVL